MLSTVLVIFSLLRFTNCPSWVFFQSAPSKDVRIIGTLNGKVYLQASNGPIYCNTQNQWQECAMSTFALSHKDAPIWLNSYFTAIPEQASVVQLTRVEEISRISYYTLLENNQIWVCLTDFISEVKNIVYSGAIIWLMVPTGIGLWCAATFMKLLIKGSTPTIRDFFGRVMDIK